MTGKLENRSAIVTGAARGIGLAIARRFLDEGARVLLADRDATALEAAVAPLGERARGFALDVSDEAAVGRLVETAVATWGGLDILVNNAAIADDATIARLDMATYRRVLQVNLEGAVLTARAAAPHLAMSPSARILNVASIQGFRGTVGSLAYGTAKGGLINLTRALACDLADQGILVNALAPGFVNTRLALLPDGHREYETDWFQEIYVKNGRIPLRRPAEPEEMAGPAVFLCSDDARYVTGQILAVDGGMTATF